MKLTWIDRIGLGLGVPGMIVCLVGLLVDIVYQNSTGGAEALSNLAQRLHMETLWGISTIKLGEGPVQNLRQVVLIIGAILLLASAMTQGKGGLLFIVLEAALVAYGIVYFLPIDANWKLAIRLVIPAVAWGTMWRCGILGDCLSKMSAMGLEFLGIGYAFGWAWSFLVGGLLLTISSGFGYQICRDTKQSSWIKLLWFCLNLPFALFSWVILVTPLIDERGHLNAVFQCTTLGAGGFLVVLSFFINREVHAGKKLVATILTPVAPIEVYECCPSCKKQLGFIISLKRWLVPAAYPIERHVQGTLFEE